MDNNSYFYSKEFGCYVDDIASEFDLWLEHIQLDAEKMSVEELNKNYAEAIMNGNKELEELYAWEISKRNNDTALATEYRYDEDKDDNRKYSLENYTAVEEDELPC